MSRPAGPAPAVFLFLLAASFLAFAVLAPAVHAQVPPAQVEFEAWADPPRVAVEPGWTRIDTPWAVHMPNPPSAATLADGKATLAWALDCGDADLRLRNATTPMPYDPRAHTVEGVAGLEVQAAAGTLGLEALPCTLSARFTDGSGTFAAEAARAVSPVVQFVGGITASVPSPVKQAGPQRQIPYEIEVANAGNAVVRVAFELVDGPGGRWNALPPQELLLGPGAANTAIFTVATPFHQGFVSSAGNYTVRVLATTAADAAAAGEPVEVQFRATAKGWYVPGPSPLAVLGALAGAAALARRARGGRDP